MWQIIILLTILKITTGDIYFPDDSIKYESVPTVSNQYLNGQEHNPVQYETKFAAPTIHKYENNNNNNNNLYDTISNGITNLCLGIDRLTTNETTPFLVYSPISIASALFLLLLGANGKTFEELSSILGLGHVLNINSDSISVHKKFGEIISYIENFNPQSSNDSQLINFANGLFIQNDYPIQDEYKDASTIIYGAEIKNVDFKQNVEYTKHFINNWVSTKTHQKIQNIIPDTPSPYTKAIIVNSLYFKSDWDNPFESTLTKMQPFYSNGRGEPSTAKVPLMANGGEYPYHNDTLLDCEIVGLPYKGKAVTFYVIIPHASNRYKLRDLENRLTYAEINRLINNMVKIPAIVAIPKMKLDSTIHLNHILYNLGLRTLFNPAQSNLGVMSQGVKSTPYRIQVEKEEEEQPYIFSRNRELNGTKLENRYNDLNLLDDVRRGLNINNHQSNPGLYADQIYHKVYVDVNEKGTEAAAATSVSISRSTRTVVKANVPFSFFIYHEQTKMILFWGSVNLPKPHFSN